MAPQVGLEPFGLKWCRAAAHTLASLCISARTDVVFFCHRQRRRLFPLRQQPCFARCFPPWVIGLCRISATKKSDTLLCTWFFGSSSWARTNDPAVNSRMLCQLSYWGIYTDNPNKIRIICSGNYLLSRAVSRQVSSTLRSLTSVFGMGTGGSSLLSSPDFSFFWGYTLKTKQCISLDSISNSYALTFLVKPSVY